MHASPASWLLVASLALAGFAVFPSCFIPTAGDGLSDTRERTAAAWRGRQLYRGRCWTVPLIVTDDPTRVATRALQQRGWRVVAAQGGRVTAARGRSRAWITWLRSPVPGEPQGPLEYPVPSSAPQTLSWYVFVVQREDLVTGQPTPTWPNQPWEELRLLHLLVPGHQPTPGWEPWPAGVPLSLHAAALHHWDPYTVADPRFLVPEARAQVRP